MIRNYLRIIILVAIAGLFYPASPAYAETSAEGKSGVTISPAIQEITLNSDQSRKDASIEITNRTSSELTFRISAVDFKNLDESGGVAFVGPTSGDLVSKYGLSPWVSLGRSTIKVAAGEKQSIKAVVLNKGSLAPGGHYGAVVFSVEAVDPKTGLPNVNLKQTLAALLFVKKVGGERYDLQLNKLDFKTSGQLPTELSLRFYNPGNIHVVPRGVVKLLNSSGQVVSQGVINQESGPILPETFRIYNVKLSLQEKVDTKPGRYKMVAEYRYDGYDGIATKTVDFQYGGQLLATVVAAILITGAALSLLLLAYHRWPKQFSRVLKPLQLRRRKARSSRAASPPDHLAAKPKNSQPASRKIIVK